MRTKQFEAATGLSRHTVRFYEREGLLPAPARSGSNGYREYDDALVSRAKMIKQAQRLGFTLGEIRQSIERYDTDAMGDDEQVAFMGAKIDEIDARIEGLSAMRGYLVAKIDWVRGGRQGPIPFIDALTPSAAPVAERTRRRAPSPR